MAKLEDFYNCDLRYTDEGYVIIDEDYVRPCIYEDNDEYIKEFWEMRHLKRSDVSDWWKE